VKAEACLGTASPNATDNERQQDLTIGNLSNAFINFVVHLPWIQGAVKSNMPQAPFRDGLPFLTTTTTSYFLESSPLDSLVLDQRWSTKVREFGEPEVPKNFHEAFFDGSNVSQKVLWRGAEGCGPQWIRLHNCSEFVLSRVRQEENDG
jgi:hypothetical protein